VDRRSPSPWPPLMRLPDTEHSISDSDRSALRLSDNRDDEPGLRFGFRSPRTAMRPRGDVETAPSKDRPRATEDTR
jgi:hypothetical protein